MNTRIRNIRRALDLTQQVFAERIGMKQNSIALIESGKRNISDQAILSICREFNVREEWIRTGKGEMFKPKPTDALDQIAYQYKISNTAYVMIEKFVALRPEIQNGIFDYFREVTTALEEMNPTAPAYNAETKPRPMDNFIKNSAQSFPKTPEELEKNYPSINLKQHNSTAG